MAEPTQQQSIEHFLRLHAPFEQMQPVHLGYLAQRLELCFYSSGQTIASPEEGPARHLFIIKQGQVSGRGEDGELAWELGAGEIFPVGALLTRRPVRLTSNATQDTFCYRLPREAFEHLIKQSPVLHDFCTRRLANLLDHALQQAQHSSLQRLGGEAPLTTPIADLVRRPPVSCIGTTALQEAMALMQQEGIGSLVVVDATGRPTGLFTLHDLLERVSLPGLPLDTPIEAVMTPRPVTLPAETPVYEALLQMARHGIGHLLVTHQGKLHGILTETDLLSHQRPGLVELHRVIQQAADVTSLAAIAGQVPPLVDKLLAQGASVAQLTRLISTVNDTLTRRIITLMVESEPTPPPAFTWLTFGSEGRHEQTLKTDQDNGILFVAEDEDHAHALRQRLLPLAKRINDALAECGFPLCPGNVMASNPHCCLSLDEWQQRFERWIAQGTPEHLLQATIFFDFRALHGPREPAEQLRERLLEQTARNSRFRHQLAELALTIRPPLGLLRDFALSHGGEHPHTLDLKLNGLTPFVDAARITALATGLRATGTEERLQAAAQQGVLNGVDVQAWLEAYHFIQLLRMRHHREQARSGAVLDNRLDPDQLNALDRRILKEAFRQGRKLQGRLALEYAL